jgi:Putative zinc-finger/Domain of unknown function (DUF4384)
MNLAVDPPLWPACLSAFRLDRWMMGELPPPDAQAVKEHLAGCATCTETVAGMRAVRDEVRILPLPSIPGMAPSPRPRTTRLVLGGLAVALAASLVVALQPEAPLERPKGSGVALGMYVQHGDEVRRAGPGEFVSPGDAVRFSITTPVPSYVAVLSLDPSGRASVYFPEGGRTVRVPAGPEVPLPLGTRLDQTVGEERLLALFCTAPVELEPVRRTLEQAGEAAPLPPGCQGVQWSFVKR